MNKKDKPMDKWATVALPKELVEKLRAEAQTQDRSLSWWLRQIVEQHFISTKK